MENDKIEKQSGGSNIPWGWILGGLGLIGLVYYFMSKKTAVIDSTTKEAILPDGTTPPGFYDPTVEKWYRLGYWKWEILKTSALIIATIARSRAAGKSLSVQLATDAQLKVDNNDAILSDFQSFVDLVSAKVAQDQSTLPMADKTNTAVLSIVDAAYRAAVIKYAPKISVQPISVINTSIV